LKILRQFRGFLHQNRESLRRNDSNLHQKSFGMAVHGAEMPKKRPEEGISPQN
jgi:hypothetical protein